MDYTAFKNRFQNVPFILSRDASRLEKNSQIMRNQLSRWQKRGLVVKLRQGMYLLNKNDRRIEPSLKFIANQLYSPSYVSLEYALWIYGLIPEAVFGVTSVTTKKTARFKNEMSVFIYQHIKPAAFRGFKTVKDETGASVFIAEPEKAAVDFLYLNLSKFRTDPERVFELSYRFQNLEDLKPRRLIALAKIFEDARLMKAARAFCRFAER